MRHKLALALQMETSGNSLSYSDHPFEFVVDEAAIKKGLDDEDSLLVDFQGQMNSSEGMNLQTNLAHIFGRIDRIDPGDDAQKTTKADLVARALTVMGNFNQKIEDADKTPGHIPPALTQLKTRLSAQSFNANVNQAAHSSFSMPPASGSPLTSSST
ncbi:hypothetical protein JTB14_011470 [Gonioctena quinquepunctata]|nr:hypothetical protein JTB14_011470 [Gonioctena quinquepunctata]